MKKLFYISCILIMINSIVYAQQGKQKGTTAQDTVDAVILPVAVQAAIEKEFPGYLITAIRKFDTPEVAAGPYFEVQLEKEKEVYSVRISPEGKILKKTAIKAEAKEPTKEY